MRDNNQPVRIAVLTEAGLSESQTALTLSVLQATADEVRKQADIEIYLVGQGLMGIEGLESKGTHRGQRWNAALEELRETDAEAVLFLEADTIIDANLIESYVEFLGNDYGGLSIFDHYVMDTESERCVFWDGHTGTQRNTPLANGRCLSRRWLDEVQWAVFAPDADDLTEGMKAKWHELICQAAHAGESRVFGCIASQLGVTTFRAAGIDFFEQSGDSANTQPVGREVFLNRHYGDLAEVIMTGEVPDLSFDEPAYSIEEDLVETAADQAEILELCTSETVGFETDKSERDDIEDRVVENDVVEMEDLQAGMVETEANDGATENDDRAECSAEQTKTRQVEMDTVPESTAPVSEEKQPAPAAKTSLKRRTIHNDAVEGSDLEISNEKKPMKLTRRSIQGDKVQTSEELVPAAATTERVAATGPDPQTPEEWVQRGEAAFGEGDLDEAERCFRQALMLNPIHSAALNDLAVVHHQRGHADEAERLYLKAVTFDNDQADAFVGLIGLSASTGQTSLAIRYAARGLKRAPEHPQLLQVVNELTQSAGGITAQQKGA